MTTVTPLRAVQSAPHPSPHSAAEVRQLRPRHNENAALHEMAYAFVQLYLEVECGLRPWGTLRRAVHPQLLLRLIPVWVRPSPHPPRLLSFTGTRTASDQYSGVGVVQRGDRCGAVSVELRCGRNGWQVTNAIRPEDGPLPDLFGDADTEDLGLDMAIPA